MGASSAKCEELADLSVAASRFWLRAHGRDSRFAIRLLTMERKAWHSSLEANRMKKKPDLPQGTLDLLVLKTLSLEAMHGYGIGQRIQQLADGMLLVEEGTLYPALYRIEQRGWIEAEWGVSENGRRARFYKLTRKGRKQLQEEEQHWEHLSLAVAKILGAN